MKTLTKVVVGFSALGLLCGSALAATAPTGTTPLPATLPHLKSDHSKGMLGLGCRFYTLKDWDENFAKESRGSTGTNKPIAQTNDAERVSNSRIWLNVNGVDSSFPITIPKNDSSNSSRQIATVSHDTKYLFSVKPTCTNKQADPKHCGDPESDESSTDEWTIRTSSTSHGNISVTVVGVCSTG